jgi:cell division protein FtsB
MRLGLTQLLHASPAFYARSSEVRLKPLSERDSPDDVTRKPALNMIRSAFWPTVAAAVIIYFAGAAIVGQNGLFSLAGYRHQRADHLATLKALDAERDRLAHHADLLDPRHVDPDYAEETVRKQTGQIRPDEVIVPVN